MTDQEFNENDLERKDSRDLHNKLFDFLVYEMSMRKRIVGRTDQMCRYPGTYYYDQDPSQTKFMMWGETFPPVVVRPSKGKYGGSFIGSGIWILHKEERPRKAWHEFGHVYLLILIFVLSAFLLRLVLTMPLPWSN